MTESLPRGRDGEFTGGLSDRQVGITPARAGRRPPQGAGVLEEWNHSRAGGTEPSRHRSSQGDLESLPRGRDGALANVRSGNIKGITPARAGRR